MRGHTWTPDSDIYALLRLANWCGSPAQAMSSGLEMGNLTVRIFPHSLLLSFIYLCISISGIPRMVSATLGKGLRGASVFEPCQTTACLFNNLQRLADGQLRRLLRVRRSLVAKVQVSLELQLAGFLGREPGVLLDGHLNRWDSVQVLQVSTKPLKL
jgi:hypothetical protein